MVDAPGRRRTARGFGVAVVLTVLIVGSAVVSSQVDRERRVVPDA